MDCIFCRIIDRTAPGSIIYEDDLVTAFMDIHDEQAGRLADASFDRVPPLPPPITSNQ